MPFTKYIGPALDHHISIDHIVAKLNYLRYVYTEPKRCRFQMDSWEIQLAIHIEQRQRLNKNFTFAFALSKWTLKAYSH